MAPRSLSLVVVSIAVIVLLAITSPQIAGVVRLNLANASLVRSLSLPADAPDRAAGVASAQSLLQDHRSDLPRSPLARARISLGQGDAKDAYGQLATMPQPDALSLFIRANVAWQIGNTNAAIEDWRQSGAFTYFREQVIRELGSHDWPAALRDAEIATLIEPENSTAHLSVADALSHSSPVSPRVSKELDLALLLTRSDEERSTILSLQGELLAQAGKLDEAKARFEDAIRVAPTDARPRTGLAQVLLRANSPDRDQAVQLLTQVTRDSPWYTAAYSTLAEGADKDGDAEGAERWLLTGLEANRNNPYLLAALGDFYARHQQSEKARAALIAAMRYETHPDELKAIAGKLAELNAP